MEQQRGHVILKGIAWLIGVAVLILAAWFGVNATDEPLSKDAMAAMNVPPPPAPSEKNGFIDFLVLGLDETAPTFAEGVKWLNALNRPSTGKGESKFALPSVEIDARIPQCRSEEDPCLETAAARSDLRGLIEGHRVFLERYRRMRDKPEFVSLWVPGGLDDPIPDYQRLFHGQRLSQLLAAVLFNAGDRAGAIRELESENAFHRRVAAGSRTLLDKMIAYALIQRDTVFVAELAQKMPRSEKALWPRLEALVRGLTKEELDVVPVLKQELATAIGRMQSRSFARLPDSMYEAAKEFPEAYGGIGTRPWWDPAAPYLYRPHQTINRYVARWNTLLPVADLPGPEFVAGSAAAREKRVALKSGPLAGMVLNPVGENHYSVDAEFSDYIGRTHGLAGTQSLVELLVMLKAGGMTRAEDVRAALEGPLGRSHPDPFTGKPMRFDPKTGTIGFDAPPQLFAGLGRTLIKRYGRIALPL